MIVQRVVIQDFLPFEGRQEVVLEKDDARTVIVVFGDNMRGKTSLLNALRWSLYGRARTQSGREIPLTDLLNREAASDGRYTFSVTIEFSVGTDAYRLVRKAEPRDLVAAPKREGDYRVSLVMAKNGTPLTSDQIEHEINQVAPQEVSRFFLFDGELLAEYEELMYEGSRQGTLIRESIERVLGVPALVRARDDLRVLHREAIKTHNTDAKQAENVRASIQRRDEFLGDVEEIEREIASYDAMLESADGEIRSLEVRLEGAEQALEDAGRLAQVKSSLVKENESVEHLQVQLLEARAGVWQDVLAIGVATDVQTVAKQFQKAAQASGELERWKERVASLERELDEGTCATCGQVVGAEARRRIGESLEALYARRPKPPTPQTSLDALGSRHADLARIQPNGSLARARDLETRIGDGHVHVTQLESQVQDLTKRIEGKDTDALRRIRTKRDALLGERGTVADRRGSAEAKRERVEREIAALQRLIESSSVSARAGASTARRKLYEELYGRFSAAIDRLRHQLRSEVEANATRAFREMTSQEHYDRLEINESYGLSIIDDEGRNVPLRSAGAEQVVALSLIDGLYRTGMGGGAVFMDTPFGRLDPTHRANILGYMAESTQQLVLLVHEGEMHPDRDLAIVADRVARTYELVPAGVFNTRIQPRIADGF